MSLKHQTCTETTSTIHSIRRWTMMATSKPDNKESMSQGTNYLGLISTCRSQTGHHRASYSTSHSMRPQWTPLVKPWWAWKPSKTFWWGSIWPMQPLSRTSCTTTSRLRCSSMPFMTNWNTFQIAWFLMQHRLLIERWVCSREPRLSSTSWMRT